MMGNGGYTYLNGETPSSIFNRNKDKLLKYLFIAGIAINLLLFTYVSLPHRKVHHHTDINTPITGLVVTPTDYESHLEPLDFQNASAIFNEIHNALKQKNADIFPISVSYFPVYIPTGTLFYHSTRGSRGVPTGPEWIAMDYEFSYNFAHFQRPGGGGPGGPHHHHGGPPGGPGGPGNGKKGKGGPGGGGGPPPWGGDEGLSKLYTFRTTRPLTKVVYLGGASAAKTSTGEMDTQYLWSGVDKYEEFNERIGAEEICKWGAENGGLDGVVRLEIGFEMILCDFTDGIELIGNVTLSNATDIIGFPGETVADVESIVQTKRSEEHDTEGDISEEYGKQRSALIDRYSAVSGFDQYRAGGRVYDKEPRILLDFSKYITLINRTYISPDPYVRRIHNISQDLKQELFEDLQNSQSYDNNPFISTDWQVVTEAITEKFSPLLLNLNRTFTYYNLINQHANETIQLDLAKKISIETYNFVRRYIDQESDIASYDAPIDFTNAKKFAIWEYSHNYKPIITKNDKLIWNSVVVVTEAIITNLFDIFEKSKNILDYQLANNQSNDPAQFEVDIEVLSHNLQSLLSELKWADFHRCSSICDWDELCFVPTWGPSPLGWGEDVLGTVKGEDGISRIPFDLKCISYTTILDHTNFFNSM